MASLRHRRGRDGLITPRPRARETAIKARAKPRARMFMDGRCLSSHPAQSQVELVRRGGRRQPRSLRRGRARARILGDADSSSVPPVDYCNVSAGQIEQRKYLSAKDWPHRPMDWLQRRPWKTTAYRSSVRVRQFRDWIDRDFEVVVERQQAGHHVHRPGSAVNGSRSHPPRGPQTVSKP